MKLTNKSLRKMACKLEAGLVEVDAVEGIEYLRWVRAILAVLPVDEVNEWLAKVPRRDIARVQAEILS